MGHPIPKPNFIGYGGRGWGGVAKPHHYIYFFLNSAQRLAQTASSLGQRGSTMCS
ncbi:hypothetical protein HanPSC8_Chr05g0194971 [Helianthus annuus]|nr:hypothetical protein HanPSC8_Chr13g0588921 [Helianthus annuus]KAJ0921728.1 hypothetical protein HanPSC8_Chr05g0194971 [Helianthus annuus]